MLLEMDCSGTMKLNDSVSLEPVNYNFSFKISENVAEKLEKDQFTLDIISILWENIVLEQSISNNKSSTSGYVRFPFILILDKSIMSVLV